MYCLENDCSISLFVRIVSYKKRTMGATNKNIQEEVNFIRICIINGKNDADFYFERQKTEGVQFTVGSIMIIRKNIPPNIDTCKFCDFCKKTQKATFLSARFALFVVTLSPIFN